MRRIPENHLGYPVLIKIHGSLGTGFYLSTETNVYLVTAAHVTHKAGLIRGSNLKLTSPSVVRSEGEMIIEMDLNLLSSEIKVDIEKDVCVIRLGERHGSTFDLLEGVTITRRTTSGIVCVEISNTKKIANVVEGNEIYVMGYPISLGLQQNPQFDISKPLIRGGIVAGINASKDTIILDCAVFKGNSGGPVIEMEMDGQRIHYKIIGVVIQLIPHNMNRDEDDEAPSISNSGYAVAASMDRVFELLHESDL